MAETVNLSVGENTVEYVAYRLMKDVASAEGITIHGMGKNANREWILRTYMQCLTAVRAPHIADDVIAMYR